MELFGDFKSLKDFADVYRKAPRKLPRVSAGVLNALAFETRTEAIDVLTDELTIRRPAFVRRQMRVNKARGAAAISSQRATAGSVAVGRFTGWLENEQGDRRNRTHFATTAGRRGSTRNIIPARFRLNKDFPEQGGTRLGAFLAMRRRSGDKKRPFIMKGGLYRLAGKRKIKLLQSFQAPAKTERIRWMQKARGRALASNSVPRLWDRQVKFLLTPRR